MKMNPYNCTKPANLFVGYDDILEEMMDGFVNGNSYAVLGGRRCGKTSFLIQMEKLIQGKGLTPFNALPGRFSIQEVGKLTPNTLFEKIYDMSTQGIDTDAWNDGQIGKEYQHFLRMMDKAAPKLTQKYGTDWLIILMIDELDAALTHLEDDQFFQNLRNLLMESRYNLHFRLIATGVKDMAMLITSGSSPLNNLRNRHLGILGEDSAQALVNKGFDSFTYNPMMLKSVFDLSGRHPFILQGILEYLWTDKPSEWDVPKIQNSIHKFIKEHGQNFQRWVSAFGIAEKTIYRFIAESSDPQLHISDIRKAISYELRPEIDNALCILSYHGIIDDNDPNNFKIAGKLFRTWFIEHCLDYTQDEKLLKAHAILKELSSDLSKLPIDNALKKESLMILADSSSSDKNKIRWGLETITKMLVKQRGRSGDAIFKFIQKAENLCPYIGMDAGCLSVNLNNLELDTYNEFYELYNQYLEQRNYGKASEMADRIYNILNDRLKSLDRVNEIEYYNAIAGLSSYWRLNRDLYNARKEL